MANIFCVLLIFMLLSFVGCNKVTIAPRDGTTLTPFIIPEPFSSNEVTGLNTAANEYGFKIALDGAHNAYITGYTTGNLADTNGGGGLADVFVKKINKEGQLVWKRQLGVNTLAEINASRGTNFSASGNDYGADIQVTPSGDIVLVGCTDSALGGTRGGALDLFLMKMSSTGSVLKIQQLGAQFASAYQASTGKGLNFIADDCGSHTDTNTHPSMRIATDGSIYVTSFTRGALGELNAAVSGSADIYILKFDSDLELKWYKHYGRTSYPAATLDDFPTELVFSADGHPVVIGYTSSELETGRRVGGEDFFWTKVNRDTGNILWVRQLGGTANDIPTSAVLDSSGSIFIAGQTRSDLFLNERNTNGLRNITLLEIDSLQGTLRSSRQFGDTASVEYNLDFSGNEIPKAIALTSDGRLVMAGSADGGGADAWVGIFRKDGSLQAYKKYLSGFGPTSDSNGIEVIESIISSPQGNLLFLGQSNGNFMAPNIGGYDLFYFGLNTKDLNDFLSN